MSKLIWSDVLGNQYADGSLADGLLRHYLTPPPAPAAPPKPTWEPSAEATAMLVRYWRSAPQPLPGPFLRRLYAQLHRDRVAALPQRDPGWVEIPVGLLVRRDGLLSLADDGNGA